MNINNWNIFQTTRSLTTMSQDRDMVRSGLGDRSVAGRSPPLRRRRTKDYVPTSRSRQRTNASHAAPSEDLMHVQDDEPDYVTQENGFQGRFYDENSNSLLRTASTATAQLQDILRNVPAENSSHLSERYQILRSENKILRERLQNALQREMKALKTFKRLAKENRQLKLNLRKYERTLLGLYDDESGELVVLFYSSVVYVGAAERK